VFEGPDPVGAIVGLQQLVQRELHLGRQSLIEQLRDPLALSCDGAADQILQVGVAGRDDATVRQVLQRFAQDVDGLRRQHGEALRLTFQFRLRGTVAREVVK
jgi:hypothetical protein